MKYTEFNLLWVLVLLIYSLTYVWIINVCLKINPRLLCSYWVLDKFKLEPTSIQYSTYHTKIHYNNIRNLSLWQIVPTNIYLTFIFILDNFVFVFCAVYSEKLLSINVTNFLAPTNFTVQYCTLIFCKLFLVWLKIVGISKSET